MANEVAFAELMQRVRQGDKLAFDELMRTYRDEVERVARIRLRGTGSSGASWAVSDVVQDVMLSFFKRAEGGGFESGLQSPDELLKLLATMVRFKVISQARRTHAGRRGGDLDPVELFDSLFVATPSPSPSEEAVRNELLVLAREVMNDDEWRLWELKYGEKLEWEDVARKLGGTAEAQRKRLDRVKDRLREQFAEESWHGTR